MKDIDRLRAGASVTIACTGTISFTSVEHLAYMAGFGWTSWLYPVVLDVVAAVGTDVWLRRLVKSWQWGAILACLAITLSLAANTLDHWLTTHTVLAAVLGAVPPGVLAVLLVVVHKHGAALAMTTKRKAPRKRAATTARRRPAARPKRELQAV